MNGRVFIERIYRGEIKIVDDVFFFSSSSSSLKKLHYECVSTTFSYLLLGNFIHQGGVKFVEFVCRLLEF